MARPNWEFIRVDVLLPGHPKLAGLSRSARWTLVELWCHCGQYHTDGWVREAVWKTVGSKADRDQIVKAELAEPAPMGGYIMHDYTDHNRSKAEIQALSAKRAEAGRKGGSAGSKSLSKCFHVSKQVLAGCLRSEQPEAVAVAVADPKSKSKTARARERCFIGLIPLDKTLWL